MMDFPTNPAGISGVIDRSRILKVRVSVPGAPSGAPLAVPGGGTVYGGCDFSINPPAGEPCDFWVVMGFAHDDDEAMVAPANTLFICGEPPAKKLFPRSFYRQFAHVVDTHAYSRHPGLILGAPCLGHGIRRPFDELASLPRPVKEAKISVLCSSTAKSRGQRDRLRFLSLVKDRLGDRIVHYGRGFRPIEDRLDAILPYAYHLVLENSSSPHYWTEKLASAYVGWAHPIYYGCPNLEDYFSASAFTAINIRRPEAALQSMLALLERGMTAEQEAEVERARRQVLFDYGVITRTAVLVNRLYVSAPARPVRLRGYKHFRCLDRLWARLGISLERR